MRIEPNPIKRLEHYMCDNQLNFTDPRSFQAYCDSYQTYNDKNKESDNFDDILQNMIGENDYDDYA